MSVYDNMDYRQAYADANSGRVITKSTYCFCKSDCKLTGLSTAGHYRCGQHDFAKELSFSFVDGAPILPVRAPDGSWQAPGNVNERIVSRCYTVLGNKCCQLPTGHAGLHTSLVGERAPVAVLPVTSSIPAVQDAIVSVKRLPASTPPLPLVDLRRLLSDTPQPWVARLNGPLGRAEVDLTALLNIEAAATRSLIFLAGLVPLGGWSKQTEQELLACVRTLKSALRGGK